MDSTIWVYYILAKFQLVLAITEGEILKSVSFSQFYQFLHHIPWSSVIWIITFQIISSLIGPFINMKWTTLSLIIVFALKSNLFHVNIATPVFFWLVLASAWYIFSILLFLMFLSLHVKVCWTLLSIQYDNPCLLIRIF